MRGGGGGGGGHYIHVVKWQVTIICISHQVIRSMSQKVNKFKLNSLNLSTSINLLIFLNNAPDMLLKQVVTLFNNLSVPTVSQRPYQHAPQQCVCVPVCFLVLPSDLNQNLREYLSSHRFELKMFW